jgi:hypothetical protein
VDFLRGLYELVGSDIVFECQRGKISPFVVIGEMIGDNDARDAAGIQTINEGASDEARRAGYEKAACRA